MLLLLVSACLLLLLICFSVSCQAKPSASAASYSSSTLHSVLLQQCIDRCKENEGEYCCGNRLNGESLTSSWNNLSCANGCEIAFYSKSVPECHGKCEEGNAVTCSYTHPDITNRPFDKCQVCQEGCRDKQITNDECSIGCDEAANIDQFYQRHLCKDDEEWRFEGDSKKSCSSWVNENPNSAKKKCNKRETVSEKHAGKKVHEICPVACKCAVETCAYCGPVCRDDPNFQHRGDPKKTCKKWVSVRNKKKKAKRCNNIDGVREACPATCGGIREGDVCENENDGVQVEMCIQKKWQVVGCVKQDAMGVGHIGYHPAHMLSDTGTYGWSYYRRAFDLIRDTPVQELGWGQWTSGHKDNLEVCGRHPHSFVCGEIAPADEEFEDGGLQNCGSQDLDTLAQCKFDCCGDEENKCWLSGVSNIEGGMGYWMYTLENPHVKWMGPSAVNHWYRSISGTFLATAPNMCTKLGGAVRISNNIVLPNDMVQFDVPEDGNIDGFLGYMVTRTPIGKRGEEDTANHWTILLDAENFSGPVYYISSWFWDSISSWHPKSISWADPSILITYAQEGFEGNIGSFVFTDQNGSKWIRTNQIAFPQDKIDNVLTETTTLATGHSMYENDWATHAMESMLSGNGPSANRTVDYVREISQTRRTKPDCFTQSQSYGEGAWELSTSVQSPKFGGFGIGETLPIEEEARKETDEAHCHTRLSLEKSELSCDSGFCQTREYIKMNETDNQFGVPVKTRKVPSHVKRALNLFDFEPTKQNDGRHLGPPGRTESACFDKPGPAPADTRLYCTRLASGTWLGFRWYRFVDQPELNQVFASIEDSADRNAAKCFMQERIERLHEAVASGGPMPRWFTPPQGDDKLPKEKVKIDPAYLVTPPKGLEKGFVPIAVWERNREPSDDCDVFLGEHTSEPEPYPDGYYDDHVWDEGGYFNQVCQANKESDTSFTFPGTVYPYPHKDYNTGRKGYDVPLKEDVGSVLDATPVTCGLYSDTLII